MSEPDTIAVIDNGSFNIKAGLSTDETPTHIFRTLLSENPKCNKVGISTEKPFIFGYSSDLKCKSPFEGGLISNWDHMEAIWQHTIYDVLNIVPEECGLVLTEHINSPVSEREKITQIMFETFSTNSFYLANDSVMSSFSIGKTDSLVVNMGEEETQIVPMFEGYALRYASETIEIGGRHVTEHILNQLNLNGHNFDSNNDLEFIRKLKESQCYIEPHFDSELERSLYSKPFELPDKSVLDIGNERTQAPELAISPLAETIEKSIMKLDIDLKRIHFFSRILLCGGNSLFEGLPDRLSSDLLSYSPSSSKISIEAPKEREFSAWKGASIIGSLSSFNEVLAMGKEEYEEVGPNLVQRKCF